MKTPTIVAALAVGLLVATVASGPAFASTNGPRDRAGDESLSVSEEDLLQSGEPVRVLVDAETGLPVSVERLTATELDEITAVPSSEATAKTAYPNACTSARGCWRGVALPSGPPSQSIGFGVGVTTGTWNNRGDFWVPPGLKAKICWVSNQCTDRLYGPNVLIETGGNVVGTKVTVAQS
ncbi:hypothetical protein SRABI76_01765 [Microbacterium oxydans]|nr:hypothetical protein SRABI76_01765 [Microbacterium oxydans]